MRIQLVSIPVDDPVKAFHFYTEVLGFVEVMFDKDSQLAIVASPEEPEGTAILLEPRGDSFYKTFQEGVFAKGLPVIVLGVDDIQAEYEKLKERGVEFKSMPQRTEWGNQAVFKDTCGNYIQLYQK